jgi:predicted transcriptional regulator of viral defense system
MASFDDYLDRLLSRGRSHFSRDEAARSAGLKPAALSTALARATKRRRVVSPRQGFYIILRPEDWIAGAPDPVRWIDPLMRHQRLAYRVSLLRAAAFHGASHQASMVFQVVVPRQLRPIEIGRHRLQFVYQSPAAFAETNRPEWLGRIKSDAGFATVAGIELTLLDCARYFRKASGICGVAQIVLDIGAKAKPATLRALAAHYESATVRRLGYLLDRLGHARQARALEGFAWEQRNLVPLNPGPAVAGRRRARAPKVDARWKLLLNDSVEVAR